MITTTIKWFDPREKLPEEDGYCLVCTGNAVPTSHYQFCQFTSNLHDFDNIDFQDSSFDHSGFIDFDESCYRWREIPLTLIKYWAKIPKIKEEN